VIVLKILITGSNGQLGRELVKQLEIQKKYELIRTNHNNFDITNTKKVCETIKDIKPRIVINCAAYTNVDKCESDEMNAFRVNALGPKNLAVATEIIGAKLVHVSTDYVFDGNTDKSYREYDKTNPTGVYGKSKLLGENYVRMFNPRHFIIRTAWLYGEGHNFVKTMLKLGRGKNEVNIVGDQTGSPTSTVDLAGTIIRLIGTEYYDTYHGTCEGSCTWFDFAKKIFELNKVIIKVNKITTEQLNRPAPRPKYSVLDNFMLNLIGLNTFRYWEEALEEYLRQLK